MESILKVIHYASCELQNVTLLLPVAIDLINTTKNNLSNMWCDAVWKNTEKGAKAKAMKNGVEINFNKSKLQRKQCYKKH